MNFTKTAEQVEACRLMAQGSRILLRGGSRSGKSFITIRKQIQRMLVAPGSRHLVLRYHFNHVKTSIWHETIPAVLKLCFPDLKPSYNRSEFYLKINNSELWIGGLDEKERTEKILGTEYVDIYFNEISQISYPSVKMALSRLSQKIEKQKDGKPDGFLIPKAYFDCNPPTKKHWSYQIWFEGKDPDTKAAIKFPELYKTMKLNPENNRYNLAEGYIEQTLEGYTGRERVRFLHGEYQDEIEGTLWSEDMINNWRVINAPAMKRIVIAIDPAVSAKKDSSDETGIIAVGKGVDDHYYILADRSGIYTPLQWAKAAIDLYYELKADKIIAEVNQGGDMVESNIRNSDRSITVKKIHASRGKFIRAEPVAGLYEKGEVHHVGILAGLEDQMTSWRPMEGGDSPDRIDALVYGVTELTSNQFYVN